MLIGKHSYNGQTTKVYYKPSKHNIGFLVKNSLYGARWIIDANGDLWIWDAYYLVHCDVALMNGIENFGSLIIGKLEFEISGDKKVVFETTRNIQLLKDYRCFSDFEFESFDSP